MAERNMEHIVEITTYIINILIILSCFPTWYIMYLYISKNIRNENKIIKKIFEIIENTELLIDYSRKNNVYVMNKSIQENNQKLLDIIPRDAEYLFKLHELGPKFKVLANYNLTMDNIFGICLLNKCKYADKYHIYIYKYDNYYVVLEKK